MIDGNPEGEEPRSDGGYAADLETSIADRRFPSTRGIGIVAVTEYRLAIRSRWAVALTALFALFGVMLATFGGSAVGPEGTQRLVASLASLAVYLVPLAALAFGYDVIVGREETGWLEVVFSLPVSRGRVVVGTYLGRAVVLAGATIVGFGLVGLLLLREFGVAHWGAFLVFLGGAIAVGAAFLAIGVFVSALANEKTHGLGLALLAWVWFVLVHDLLALGVIAAFRLPEFALTGLVLANPTTVFRVLVLSHLGTTAGGGFAAVLATTSLSSGLLVGALLAWTLGPLAAASVLVRRRRL